jgi:hypothetical protein
VYAWASLEIPPARPREMDGMARARDRDRGLEGEGESDNKITERRNETHAGSRGLNKRMHDLTNVYFAYSMPCLSEKSDTDGAFAGVADVANRRSRKERRPLTSLDLF